MVTWQISSWEDSWLGKFLGLLPHRRISFFLFTMLPLSRSQYGTQCGAARERPDNAEWLWVCFVTLALSLGYWGGNHIYLTGLLGQWNQVSANNRYLGTGHVGWAPGSGVTESSPPDGHLKVEGDGEWLLRWPCQPLLDLGRSQRSTPGNNGKGG